MGEVYRAKDTRLDRTVAIKVLPASLAHDAEFRERFEREAKSISALNHPNICTLHDVGTAPVPPGDTPVEYLVMEFLDGETLAARLAKGALPLPDALRIAIDIAGALDKAHRQGIVHRDLKPGNVMLTKTGSKLLDFGLAKVGSAGSVSGAFPTVAATAMAPLTAQGTILGTFQYMAPEQIEGDEADARTDIFAFGAVLFEMITGRKAFSGKSQASLLGAILKDEPPPVSQVQPVTPPALDYLVRPCLAKDPDSRFQTAHDLVLQLKWIAEGGSAAGVPAPIAAHQHRRERLAWLVAAALGVICLVTATITVLHLREAPPVVDPIQFTISSPENSLFYGQTPQMALSPDGRQLVFVASFLSVNVLWVRPTASLVAHPLAGTDQAIFPFWSADSRFIGFFASGKLKKVQVSGRAPVVLCDASQGRGGTWSADNVILFAPSTAGPIMRTTSAGVPPTAATEIQKSESTHRWPSFLPDGKHFLFFSGTGGTGGEIHLGTLDARETVAITSSDTDAIYGASHILFSRGNSLMALPFDLASRKTTGDPFPVAEQVSADNLNYGSFSVSTTGTLAYSRGRAGPIARLTWFDRTGKMLGTAGDPAEYFNVSLSPDERHVAVSITTGSPVNRDVWLLDLSRAGAPMRFTFDPAQDGNPVWSPTGDQVAFASNRSGPWNLYLKAASGGGPEELLAKSATTNYLTDWSHDGRFLVYTDTAATTGLDLWVLPLGGDKKPVPFLQTPFNEDDAVFSPDGHWIAYDSNESGTTQVYVRPFPTSGGQYMVSRNGGLQPMWRGDSQELFFLAPDATLMSARTSSAKGFEAGVPETLFPTGVAFTGNRRQYAVAKDGKRFLVNVPEQRTSPAPIVVIVNSLAALQR